MENENARELSKILGVGINRKFRYSPDIHNTYVLSENGKIYNISSETIRQIDVNTLALLIAYPQGIILIDKDKSYDKVHVPCILKYPNPGEYFISEQKHYDRIIGVLQDKAFLAKDGQGHIYRLQRNKYEVLAGSPKKYGIPEIPKNVPKPTVANRAPKIMDYVRILVDTPVCKAGSIKQVNNVFPDNTVISYSSTKLGILCEGFEFGEYEVLENYYPLRKKIKRPVPKKKISKNWSGWNKEALHQHVNKYIFEVMKDLLKRESYISFSMSNSTVVRCKLHHQGYSDDGSEACAYCAPNDEFNYDAGRLIALNKLIGEKPVCPDWLRKYHNQKEIKHGSCL